MVQKGARWYRRVPENARMGQMVPMGAKWCQREAKGARGRQRVPEGLGRAGCGPRIRLKD